VLIILIGFQAGGWLADRYGRRGIYAVAALSMSIVPWSWLSLYLAARHHSSRWDASRLTLDHFVIPGTLNNSV
jgi:MFS family permease